MNTLHVVVAMKPIEGTFADNAFEHGVAGLNVDGGRITTSDGLNGGAYADGGNKAFGRMNDDAWEPKDLGGAFKQPTGRWPANVIHDGSEEVVVGFPQSNLKRTVRKGGGKGGIFAPSAGHPAKYGQCDYGDSGSASRFFKQVSEE